MFEALALNGVAIHFDSHFPAISFITGLQIDWNNHSLGQPKRQGWQFPSQSETSGPKVEFRSPISLDRPIRHRI